VDQETYGGNIEKASVKKKEALLKSLLPIKRLTFKNHTSSIGAALNLSFHFYRPFFRLSEPLYHNMGSF
jgi:hypothetical protein